MDLIPFLILLTISYICGIFVGRTSLYKYFLIGYRHGSTNDNSILKNVPKEMLKEFGIEIKE